MHGARWFCLAAILGTAFAAPTLQAPLVEEHRLIEEVGSEAETEKRRPLHGRFLHITDFHPDRFYEVYSSTSQDAACHRGQGPAGVYGAETSECDSPIALVNKTFEWIGEQFKDEIDFVIWTGDSARHDNDEEIPRNAGQVVGSNEFMVTKMFEVFGKHNGDENDDDPNNDYVVPIIPNLGNNDLLPHNVMTDGPNTWTRTYAKVWRQFIPEEQKHQFEQGGWFYVEVIPRKLAVFSINTLYFFSSNAAVDGCALHGEPGYQQFEWLRIQLQFMRERGMKAILIGHVPPIHSDAKTTWDETCWQKYTLWLQQYRDVIVGSMYGHFNYDHFLLQDFEDLDDGTKDGQMHNYHTHGIPEGDEDDELRDLVSSDYWLELRKDFSKLPNPPKSLQSLNEFSEDQMDISDKSKKKKKKKSKKDKQEKKQQKYLQKIGGRYAERFATSFVSSSVVPNLFPTIRVYEYNTTGLERTTVLDQEVPFAMPVEPAAHGKGGVSPNKKNKKYKFTVPQPPSKASPPGPAYSPQTLSLLKYRQYFANLTHINNDFLGAEDVSPGDEPGSAKWKPGKHKGKKPHDKGHRPQPKKFKYQLHYDTQDDPVYQLKDLTMPNLINLARRIGNFEPPDDAEDVQAGDEMLGQFGKKKRKHKHGKGKHDSDKLRKQNEAWYTFIRRAFVETMDPEELEEQFGHC